MPIGCDDDHHDDWILWATINDTLSFTNEIMRFARNTEPFFDSLIISGLKYLYKIKFLTFLQVLSRYSDLLDPMLDEYSIAPVGGHSTIISSQIVHQMACQIGSSLCLQKSHEIFYSSQFENMNYHLKQHVMSFAVRHSDSVFNSLMEAFLESGDESLMRAMTFSSSDSKVAELVKIASSTETSNVLRSIILNGLLQFPRGRDAVLSELAKKPNTFEIAFQNGWTDLETIIDKGTCHFVNNKQR